MFHTYVASVAYFLHICCKYLSRCCICFAMATHVFLSCFGRMLHMFHLDVVKVNLVLHMLEWTPSLQQPPATTARPGRGHDVARDPT
jgi:hypothetical protein